MERKVVFVLTPGRSGSSVFTQILSILGLRLSENLISATEANPQGYFEDALIVQREKAFLQSLGLPPQLPLPPSSLSSQEAGNYISFLKEYLEQQVSSDGIWLCKVPTLCSTLPLWQKAMLQSRIVPFYFLAVRDLSNTLASFLKIGATKREAEQNIFTRTVSIFQHVQSNLFIQHYEHLFDNFDQVVQEIGAWLEISLDQDRIELARQCLKPHLNRAQYQQVTPDNPFLIRLYEYISACAGINYNIGPLLHYITEMKPAFDLGETAVERLLQCHKTITSQQRKSYIKLRKEKEKIITIHACELKNCKQEYDISLQTIIKKHEAEKQEIEQRIATDMAALCDLNASQENKIYALRQEIQILLQKNHALQQQLQKKQNITPTKNLAQSSKQTLPLLSRKEKLKHKFKEHPYAFFRDSKNPFVRSLRIFFLFKKCR